MTRWLAEFSRTCCLIYGGSVPNSGKGATPKRCCEPPCGWASTSLARTEGCVATVRPGRHGSRRSSSRCRPTAGGIELMLAAFLRGDKVRVPPELMLARIRRHGRMWGALAVRAAGGDYHWDRRQAFSSIGALANELIDQIDQERVREVRARVDRKILEQSLPKHLFYEVLHGIRSLTAYDHSAALLTYDDERDVARSRRRADHLAKSEGPERRAEAAADARASRTALPPPGLRLRPRRPASGTTGPAPTRPPWRSCSTSTATPGRAAPRPARGRSCAPRWSLVPGCSGS